MSKEAKGAAFLRYVIPIVETLREFGDSGTSSEVTDKVIERLGVTDEELAITTGNGQSRERNRIGWARFYLAKANYLESSQRGLWTLTDLGRTAKLDEAAVQKLFKDVQRIQKESASDSAAVTVQPGAVDVDESSPENVYPDHRSELLGILRTLPPAGFEKICQRLLRESGFERVEVTGRSGDGGIDGHGVYEINPFLSIKVLFQCKRYKDGSPVTVSQVRDFRGAMQGRAEKGIIITTSVFTADARKEAARDGVAPIELVDQDRLVKMFEFASLGLTPKKDFEVNRAFFAEFSLP
ncbi:restriction endonuclease [Myxococcota bacterium]|nr:restriction endonuclease [Myxococcota bacterium]